MLHLTGEHVPNFKTARAAVAGAGDYDLSEVLVETPLPALAGNVAELPTAASGQGAVRRVGAAPTHVAALAISSTSPRAVMAVAPSAAGSRWGGRQRDLRWEGGGTLRAAAGW